MKKAAALLTAATLFVTPVFSESLINSTIEQYNDLTVLTGASRIGSYTVTDKGDTIEYTFKLSDSLFIEMTEQENQIAFLGVICKDEAETGEFLAACANGCYLLADLAGGYYAYSEILDQFLQARSGKETETRKLNASGIIINISRQSFGYLFAAAR